MTPTINLRHYTNYDHIGDEGDIRVMMMFSGFDAFDPKTGAYMSSSRGHRKPGRKRKYYACVGSILVRFTASNDFEAVKLANQKLNAKLQELLI